MNSIPSFQEEMEKLAREKELMHAKWQRDEARLQKLGSAIAFLKEMTNTEQEWCRRCMKVLTDAEHVHCEKNNLQYLCYKCQRKGIDGLSGQEEHLAMKKPDPRGTITL